MLSFPLEEGARKRGLKTKNGKDNLAVTHLIILRQIENFGTTTEVDLYNYSDKT